MIEQLVAGSPAHLSPEAQAFAVERGVTAYLPAVLNLVRRLFPACPFRVLLVDAPELEAYRHLAFEVQSGEREAERLLSLRQQWTRGILEVCPPACALAFLLRLR